MDTERLVVRRDLSFEARREFIAAARLAMNSTDQDVELDCSAVDSFEAVDDPVIGMLVTLARAAQRQGTRVALVRAPRPMRTQLETAGVAQMFSWER